MVIFSVMHWKYILCVCVRDILVKVIIGKKVMGLDGVTDNSSVQIFIKPCYVLSSVLGTTAMNNGQRKIHIL